MNMILSVLLTITSRTDLVADLSHAQHRDIERGLTTSMTEYSIKSRFGHALCTVPDVDGGGVRDIVVSAPSARIDSARIGSVVLFSTETGMLIARTDNEVSSRDFGVSLATSRRKAQVGHGVVAIGCPAARDDGEGVVIVADAGTLKSVLTIHDPFKKARNRPGTGFGCSAAFVGDVDGDGEEDIAVGAPDASDVQSGSAIGSVAVFSTKTGGLLWKSFGPVPQKVVDGTQAGCFASSLCGIADINMDGSLDVLVGVPNRVKGELTVGGIVCLSGKSGAQLYAVDGDNEGAFGAALDFCSGAQPSQPYSLVVGAPHKYCVLRAPLEKSKTITVPELQPGGYAEGFGASVAWIDDVNKDGCFDIAVGCAEPDDVCEKYYLAVFSGKDGALIRKQSTGDRIVVVSSIQDVDKDGVGDILIGMPSHDEVFVLSGVFSASEEGFVPGSALRRFIARW